jgi:type I restriction enzyme M protein
MAKKSSPEQTTTQRLSSIVKSVRDTMRKDKGLNGDADLDAVPQILG